MAPLVGVNEEAGRGVVLLTWAGHEVATVIVVVALWRALNGGGGWVVSSMLVVVGRKKQRSGNVSYSKALVVQLVRTLLTLLWSRVL